MSERPKAVKTEILDTREKCQNCKGTGRIPAFMCEPDNEEDGTNNCGVCSGLGFTGHSPGVHVKMPSEKDWREYADSLERTVAALKREVAELQRNLVTVRAERETYKAAADKWHSQLQQVSQPVAGKLPAAGNPTRLAVERDLPIWLLLYKEEGVQGTTVCPEQAEEWRQTERGMVIEVDPDFLTVVEAQPLAGGQTQAIQDVIAERQRQISVEGWTLDHDDAHDDGSLEGAAAAYASMARRQAIRGNDCRSPHPFVWGWQWHIDWWKPSTPRRNLIKSAALAIAAAERIDRAAHPIANIRTRDFCPDPECEDFQPVAGEPEKPGPSHYSLFGEPISPQAKARHEWELRQAQPVAGEQVAKALHAAGYSLTHHDTRSYTNGVDEMVVAVSKALTEIEAQPVAGGRTKLSK